MVIEIGSMTNPLEAKHKLTKSSQDQKYTSSDQ
jgi:hypothetical protein